LKNGDPVGDVTVRSGVVPPEVPVREKREPGVEEPIPTFPFASTEKIDEVLAISKKRVVPDIVDDPMERKAPGVVVPIPTFPPLVARRILPNTPAVELAIREMLPAVPDVEPPEVRVMLPAVVFTPELPPTKLIEPASPLLVPAPATRERLPPNAPETPPAPAAILTAPPVLSPRPAFRIIPPPTFDDAPPYTASATGAEATDVVPWIEKSAPGVVVPTPNLPFVLSQKRLELF
jgi:hypothetical protein